MKRNVFSVLAAPLAVLLFLSACSATEAADTRAAYKPVTQAAYPVDDPKGSICILVYNTDYKMKLLGDLTAEFNSAGCSVTVDDQERSGSCDPGDYDAVILLSGIQAFSPLAWSADYIKAHDYRDNIVYYSGYTLFKVPYGFKLKKKRIDAITAASKLEDQKHLQMYEDAKAAIIAAVMEIL